MNAKELLLSINACREALIFAEGKTIKQAWEECPRGDWMLWFYKKQFPGDIRKLTLAKAYCANTVRDLMQERSRYAIDVAIRFGHGFATPGKLKESAKAAYAAASGAAAYDSAAYAAYAATTSAAAYDSATAAAYAAAAAATTATAAAAKKQNQLLTADICRQFLDISSLYES